jgi:hypothetical protein
MASEMESAVLMALICYEVGKHGNECMKRGSPTQSVEGAMS